MPRRSSRPSSSRSTSPPPVNSHHHPPFPLPHAHSDPAPHTTSMLPPPPRRPSATRDTVTLPAATSLASGAPLPYFESYSSPMPADSTNALRPVASNASFDSSSSLSHSSSPNKLTKWLTRVPTNQSNPSNGSAPRSPSPGPSSSSSTRPHRSRSIGSLIPGLVNPTISISPSSSAQSQLSSMSSDSAGNPLRRHSGSSENKDTSGGGGGSVSRGFASLSLKTSRRGRPTSPPSPSDEPFEEWASADLEDGEGLLFSDEVDDGRGKATTPAPTNAAGNKTGGRFSLKRSKSNLKLFGRSNSAGSNHDPPAPSPLPRDPSPVHSFRSTDRDVTPPPIPPPSSTNNNNNKSFYKSHHPSHSHGSSSLLDLTSSSSGAANPLAQSQSSPNVAGRIGGWFSSMLHTSSPGATAGDISPPASPGPGASFGPATSRTSHSTTGSTGSFRMGSPTKTRVGHPSSVNGGGGGGGSQNGSPAQSGSGRLGPLDRMLDKAVQYFLDTDSQADKCEDEIWVMGVKHPGYVPPEVEELSEGGLGEDQPHYEGEGDKSWKRRSGPRKIMGGRGRREGSFDDRGGERFATPPPPLPTTATTSALIEQTYGWPASFYHDFYSRIALTYRTGFTPIPCSPSNGSGGGGGASGVFNALSMSIGRNSHGRTSEGLSSDTGWGCMLRTGQSLLANALVVVHLGRDWRRSLPPPPSSTSPSPSHSPSPAPSSPSFVSSSSLVSTSTYARILSLFLDDPSPISPFSIHRFALMGKQLGKEVGEWFGPSTAAGAIKTLVNAFEPAGLKVVSVNDGTVYRSEVESAGEGWRKPVLVLINLRLGIDGVNPIYHEAIKAIFRFPQSVGIAGGRPSSSYYFVGVQASSLFYIDPHHPRPAVPSFAPSAPVLSATATLPLEASSKVPVVEEYLSEGYTDASWRTYHAEKVRKMPLVSLDPSMLVGFLIKDEYDWIDFEARSKVLAQAYKPIFAIAPSPPAWMRRSGGPGASSLPSSPLPPSSATAPSFASSSAAATASPRQPNDRDLDEVDDDDDGFSEPEGWELDSTDGGEESGASSGVAVPSPALGPTRTVPLSSSLPTSTRQESDDWEETERPRLDTMLSTTEEEGWTLPRSRRTVLDEEEDEAPVVVSTGLGLNGLPVEARSEGSGSGDGWETVRRR